MAFIHDDFLLSTPAARRLYHEFAAGEPILDYHNHLPPADISGNRAFNNLFEIWLEGDHYKWRAMRANGVDESYVTGAADPREKFLAWARTVPYTLRNPLYHWTHLELERYFGIGELLDEKSAPAIWEEANALLATPEFRAQGLLKRFRVKALCTTDDPAEDLAHHRALREGGPPTRVYPTFRPDKALRVDQPESYRIWVDKLARAANLEIRTLAQLLEALDRRHAAFHEIGGRLSDHGLTQAYADFPSESEAAAIFSAARRGQAATPREQERFASFLMVFFGQLDAKRGWTKQLHLGALRNANSRAYEISGPDTGYDSVGDYPQIAALAAYLDQLESEKSLPRMVIYNLNPADNYAVSTLLGSFGDGRIAGKLQFGSGWWFSDQKEAMEWQLNALSNNGLLARFIGMLTDSRSFMSFPRHEYFRRVLCNLLGRDMENGELPADFELVGGMVRNISYANARDFLRLQVD